MHGQQNIKKTFLIGYKYQSFNFIKKILSLVWDIHTTHECNL